jgi:hypothetical protein
VCCVRMCGWSAVVALCRARETGERVLVFLLFGFWSRVSLFVWPIILSLNRCYVYILQNDVWLIHLAFTVLLWNGKGEDEIQQHTIVARLIKRHVGCLAWTSRFVCSDCCYLLFYTLTPFGSIRHITKKRQSKPKTIVFECCITASQQQQQQQQQ